MINLNYYFGCGGFYALWIILLGTDYCCEFENDNRSLDDIYKDQWNVQNISTWKSTEVRPDNDRSLNLKLTWGGLTKVLAFMIVQKYLFLKIPKI